MSSRNTPQFRLASCPNSVALGRSDDRTFSRTQSSSGISQHQSNNRTVKYDAHFLGFLTAVPKRNYVRSWRVICQIALVVVIVVASAVTATAQGPAADDIGLDQLVRLQAKVQQVIQEAGTAVVAIDDTGSGVVVSASGIVLTASHVSRQANRIVNVQFSDGRIIQGITLGSNFVTDTGAIRLLTPGPYSFLKVAESATSVSGTWCIAMGYPLSFPRGQAASARLGRVLERQENGKLVTDCTIMGGDSGGPLLNLEGKVIAINSSVKLDIEKNLYIPSERFAENWKHIALSIDRSGSQVVRAEENSKTVPNSNTVPLSDGSRSPNKIGQKPYGYLGIAAETDNGLVRVRHVHPGSPAEGAGLIAEDVITSINSENTASFRELVSQLKKYAPATRVKVGLIRLGQILEIPVTLGASGSK